jgi:predicted transcriptional regulator
MRLDPYLKARWTAVGETPSAFARRAELPQQTLFDILRGGGLTMTTADRIVTASRAEPAPSGEWVTFEDLVPRRASRRPATKKPRKSLRAAS